MERIEKSILVDCPLQTVYNQWTQFEEFPRFMEGVKHVTQLDDKRLRWEAEIAGKHKDGIQRLRNRFQICGSLGRAKEARIRQGSCHFNQTDRIGLV
jgi:hypothetical protein